jgi:sorbitol-specific phosphotransferase system component IIC
MAERSEALMRIVVGVVTGILLGIWKMLISAFWVINFVWVLVTGKRIRELADFSETWNTQMYVFIRYIIFLTNERPFPFRPLTKNISKFKR